MELLDWSKPCDLSVHSLLNVTMCTAPHSLTVRGVLTCSLISTCRTFPYQLTCLSCLWQAGVFLGKYIFHFANVRCTFGSTCFWNTQNSGEIFFADSPEAIVYLGHWSTAREGNSRKKLWHLPAVRILLISELTVTRPSSKVFQRFDKENWCEAVCSPTLELCYSSIGNWSLDLGVMGQSVSRPVGSRQTTASSVLRLVKLWAEPLISATILHLFFFFSFVTVVCPRLPPYGRGGGQVSLIYCVFKFSFWWQGIFFARLNWTWWPHSFLANMLQHMQYTVDKCVYFLYSALLNHKQQELQHQQQSAATMPSKPAVTGKCQCFNNPTPLMSAAVECLLSRVCSSVRVCVKRRPAGAMPSIQQARTMHTQEVRTGSKEGHTPPTQHPQPSRLSGAILSNPSPLTTWAPSHLSNNSSYSFSSQWTESGNWAPAPQTVFSWKNDATNAHGGFGNKKKKKRHKDF